MTSVVYFIEDIAAGAIKIGVSRRAKARFAALQTASASDLRLIGVIRGDRTTEEHLHKQFEAHRIRGEWFRRDAALVSQINLILAQAGDFDHERVRKSEDPHTEQARLWVMDLLRDAGSRTAWGDVAQLVGISPGLVQNLYRGRTEAITARDFEALRLAALAVYARRAESLERQAALVSDILNSGPPTQDPSLVCKAAAVLAEAQELHARITGEVLR